MDGTRQRRANLGNESAKRCGARHEARWQATITSCSTAQALKPDEIALWAAPCGSWRVRPP
eukprot:1327085-Rhodomonas_salina.1